MSMRSSDFIGQDDLYMQKDITRSLAPAKKSQVLPSQSSFSNLSQVLSEEEKDSVASINSQKAPKKERSSLIDKTFTRK